MPRIPKKEARLSTKSLTIFKILPNNVYLLKKTKLNFFIIINE